MRENQVYHQLGQMGLGWQESVDLLGKAMSNASGKRGPISTPVPGSDKLLVYVGATSGGASSWSITDRPVMTAHQLVTEGYNIFQRGGNLDEDPETDAWLREVRKYIKADEAMRSRDGW